MIVTTKEEKMNLYLFARAQVLADNARGGCCPDDNRFAVESFYDVLDAYGISVILLKFQTNLIISYN